MQSKRVIDFIPLVNSIGNMIPLPNKSVKLRMVGTEEEKWWTLNSYRGCCPKIQDYMDRFLDELYKPEFGINSIPIIHQSKK